MSTLVTDTAAVTRFTGVFAATYLAHDLGPELGCVEVDALAGMLRALGEVETAEMWIEAHAKGDDEGDLHYRPVEEYIVPVDPMELLQCDSCQ